MLLILFILLLVGVLPGKSREVAVDGAAYLSRLHTSMANGIFICLVFLSHLRQYEPWLGEIDSWILVQNSQMLGQLMVAPFFFFSGWGMMCSLQKKGKDYVRSLVNRRFPGLLLKFAAAVLVFWAVQSLLGQRYSWEQVLLSLVGWRSLGNSNWFIFMTLLMYLMVAGVFALLPRQRYVQGVLILGAILAPVVFAMGQLKPPYWYDTILCLPAGMWWCYLCNGKSTKELCRGGLCALILVPAGWWVYHHARELVEVLPVLSFWCGSMLANFGAVLFAWGVALAVGRYSMAYPRLGAGGRALAWCGGPALFYLYIYQRIPMLLGQHFGLQEMGYVYLVGCAAVMVLMAWGMLRCGQLVSKR